MNTHEVPLRERVRAQLLELISEMDLTVNTRLLSEGQLAAKFQVSRSTIRTSDSSGKAVPFVQLWPDTSAAGDPQPVLRG